MIYPRIFLLTLFAGLILIWSSGCTTLSAKQQDFTYKSIPIAKGTIPTGEGSSVAFRGSPLPLSGNTLTSGESLRTVQLAREDLSLIDLADTKGNVRIISIVPSLDTKVCEQQTHYLSEKNKGLDAKLSLYTISVDTPFAQARFAKEADIHNVTFLSDYRGAQFGRAHGLFLEGPHVLARAIMVVDRNNTVRYLQVTPDLGNMPDMEAAFTAARVLVGTPSSS